MLNNYKLSRRDKVYQKLHELMETITLDKLNTLDKVGFETSYISQQINISRNNVSKELNCLMKEGKVIKILGKPVLYLDRVWLESNYNAAIKEPILKNVNELKKLLLNKDSKSEQPYKSKDELDNARNKLNKKRRDCGYLQNRSIFENIIGKDDSLKSQIKQAKAAILYPPNGLNTLLIGPTGVGKTTFAEIMYRYAIETKKLKSNAPYIMFNCADYAENSQLLMSHLFGYVKGAFTGANSEKKGLIDQANGGILFLDEIHRLPPEGQEMLFTLIDKGIYRRLGETESLRKAKVLFIAATTEDPKSSLLSTFLRRIPVIIKLPSLEERSLKERMTFICEFFKEEAIKIKVPVKVSKEVLKVLLLYKCPGNIGQLKNDVQLICANAFVEYVTQNKEDYVDIMISQLSRRFKDGLITINNKRQEMFDSFNLNDFETMTFNGTNENLRDNLNGIVLYDDYKTQEDFYDSILYSAQKLYKEGFSINEVKKNMSQKVQRHFNNSMTKTKPNNTILTVDKEVLSKIVTPDIVKLVQDSLVETNMVVPMKVVYSLALHLETLIEKMRLGRITIYPNIEKAYKNHTKEYAVALKIKEKFEEKLSIRIPDDEIAFMVLFLYSINTQKNQKNIEVLVIAHGYATATNMVQVAKTLLGYRCIHALDMPLEEKVEVALENAIRIVKKINKGKGVLLLVDMGSLVTFSDIITEKTGIPTRVIKMVSTPMVIEAARKAMMPNMNLDILVENVKNMSSLIGEKIKLDKLSSDFNYRKINDEKKLMNMLEEILTFLDVKKAFKVLKEVLMKILLDYDKNSDDIIVTKFLFHCSCMIERIIRNEPLPYKNVLYIKNQNKRLFNIIKEEFSLVEEIFGVNIPDSELAYIVEMFKTHFNTDSLEESVLINK